MELKSIKLVIWDLDETFWRGIISEEEITAIPENIELIKNLTDCGIVNSICSKNDLSIAKSKLEKLGVWEYIVFPSINWQPKGARIKQLISDMALRPANVLFIDDNILNLKEACHYCEGLMTALPEQITDLYAEAMTAEKTDTAHKRLKRYQLLQEKVLVRDTYDDNEEFLKSCNIHVDIHTDCSENIERIHELLLRSNQINFTKLRSSLDELKKVIDSYDCGYITVSDKFGEYGIVGFYALKNNELLHYAFSCRTLGMGVEQYIYSVLGYPTLTVKGEVSSTLPQMGDKLPYWINCGEASHNTATPSDLVKILMKGPCDIHQICSFLKSTSTIDDEFTYVTDDGRTIAGHNHTASILTALSANDKRKKEIIKEVDELPNDFFSTRLTDNIYDFVLLSVSMELYSSVFERKATGEQFSTAWDGVSDKTLELYKPVENKNGELTVINLSKIRRLLPENTELIILLPPEMPFSGDTTKYYEKALIFNEKIRKWSADYDNVKLIELSDYVRNDKDFADGFFHYQKKVYYEIAMNFANIINEKKGTNIQAKNSFYLLIRTIYHKLPTGLRAKINARLIYKNNGK